VLVPLPDVHWKPCPLPTGPPVDSVVHVLIAADTDEDRGGGLASGDHGRVIEQAHIVGVACAGDKRHGVPVDGGVLGRVKADRAVECMVVLDVELQFRAGEIGLRQVLQPEVVEVVVSVPPAQNSEVLRSLDDPRNGQTGLRGIVDRGGCGAGRRCGAVLRTTCSRLGFGRKSRFLRPKLASQRCRGSARVRAPPDQRVTPGARRRIDGQPGSTDSRFCGRYLTAIIA